MTYAVASSTGCPGRFIGPVCRSFSRRPQQGGRDQRRPDRTRRDRVGTNAPLSQQLRESRREIVDRPLGRCVG
jgi:hypothetical protein